jgi:hypothetical protein
MIAEEKTNKAGVSNWFAQLMRNVFDPALREYAKGNDIDYRGYHVIRFENETPDDGWVWLDGVIVTTDELRIFLSME